MAGTCVFMGSLIVTQSPHQAFHIMGIGQFIGGISMAIATILYSTALQRAVPLELQGRIYSLDMFISLLVAPITIFIASPLSEKIGIVNFFLLYAILGIIMNAFVYYFGLTKISLEEVDDGLNKFDLGRDTA